MKLAARILSVLILAGVATLYISCDPNDPPAKSETDEQIEKLNGTWTLANTSDVIFEDGEPDLDHAGMTITFDGVVGDNTINYTVADRPTGPSPWPASGQFTFVEGSVKTELLRSDEVNVTYLVNENTLTMEFNFQDDPYQAGRVSSVAGEWLFTFTKQP